MAWAQSIHSLVLILLQSWISLRADPPRSEPPHLRSICTYLHALKMGHYTPSPEYNRLHGVTCHVKSGCFESQVVNVLNEPSVFWKPSMFWKD
jgi:hypothetical protein